MKILKQENIDNWEYKHTCVNCKSELLVERSDLKHVNGYSDPRDSFSSSEAFICKCPVCNNSFYVPVSVIPKLLQIKIIQDQKAHNDNHSR